MARRRLASGCARGGEEIQAPRPRRARLATALGALLTAAALAAARPQGASLEDVLMLILGGAALVLLAVGLATRWSAALAVGIAFLGAEQAVRLATGPSSVDPWTPVYAAGLLLTAELGWWSIEQRVPAWSQPGVVLRRLAVIVGLCVAGGAVAALIVLAAGAPLEGGIALELVGVVAAVAALVVVAALALRPVTEPD